MNRDRELPEQQGAGAGPDMGNNSGAADDVVDGDYREV